MRLKSATSLDNWNTSSTKLNVLAQGTYDTGIYREIIPLLWSRIVEKPKYWRIVLKCCVLIEYLLRHGSERFIDECRDKIYIIRNLQNFTYIDSEDKDRGLAIRQKSAELITLIQDENKIRELRRNAVQNINKFVSLSSSGGGSSAMNMSYSDYNEPTSRDTHPTVIDNTSNSSTSSPRSSAVTAATHRNDQYEYRINADGKRVRRKKKIVIDDETNNNNTPDNNNNSTTDDFKAHFEQSITPSSTTTISASIKPAKSSKSGKSINFANGKLAPPPKSSMNNNKQPVSDLLSLEDQFDTLSVITSKPSTTTTTITNKSQPSTNNDFFNFNGKSVSNTNNSSTTASNLDEFDLFGTSATPSPAQPTNTKSSFDSDFDLFGTITPATNTNTSQQHLSIKSPDLFSTFATSNINSAAQSCNNGGTQSTNKNMSDWTNDLVSFDLTSNNNNNDNNTIKPLPNLVASTHYNTQLKSQQPTPLSGNINTSDIFFGTPSQTSNTNKSMHSNNTSHAPDPFDDLFK